MEETSVNDIEGVTEMHEELNYNKAALMHSGARKKEKALADFIAYWSSMRKGHAIPRRTDIDPRGIEALLENAFIAEKIAPGLARFRIAGTHLNDLMGMEIRGMPISAFIAPEQRDELSKLLVEVFDRPAIVKATLESPKAVGQRALGGTLVLLPLRSDLGDASRALGCLVTNGLLGRTPRRFNIIDHSVEMVEAPEAAGPTEDPLARIDLTAHRRTTTTPATRHHGSERPYLRLVSSNDKDDEDK